MDFTRTAQVTLLLALLVLAGLGARACHRSRHDPLRLATLLEEAKGYALGRQIAADIQTGGRVVFISVDSGFEADVATRQRLQKGLQDGCGRTFEVVEHLLPLDAPDNLPGFLRLRTVGNSHLGKAAAIAAEHPGCVALVAVAEPAKTLPPPANAAKVPPLYLFGYGEPAQWAGVLAGGRVRAVQIERPEGQANGPRRMGVDAAASLYYRVETAVSR